MIKVGKEWRKGNSHALLVEIEIGAATTEKSVEIPWNF